MRHLVEELADLESAEDVAMIRELRSRARHMVGRSSSVRGLEALMSRRWCRCECCAVDDDLTVHHFIPLAVGGTDRDTVTLCESCHSLAHRVWGPGDRYRGPRTARETIVLLRCELAASPLSMRA